MVSIPNPTSKFSKWWLKITTLLILYIMDLYLKSFYGSWWMHAWQFIWQVYVHACVPIMEKKQKKVLSSIICKINELITTILCLLFSVLPQIVSTLSTRLPNYVTAIKGKKNIWKIPFDWGEIVTNNRSWIIMTNWKKFFCTT